VPSIADGLGRLLRSPDRRAELSRRARERAGEFTWERTAEGVLALLERVAQPSSDR